MEILNYQVSDGQSGIRIDRYLSEMNEELSRSYIQKPVSYTHLVLPYVKKVYARQIHQAILLIMQGRAVRSMLPERCTDLVIQKQLLLRHLLPRKNFQRYGLI